MNDKYNSLENAFLKLKTEEEVKRFMLDLCTPSEIRAMDERWLIAQMLTKGEFSYRKISKETGSSTTTVGRVSRFLREENHNGYSLVIERIGN